MFVANPIGVSEYRRSWRFSSVWFPKFRENVDKRNECKVYVLGFSLFPILENETKCLLC